MTLMTFEMPNDSKIKRILHKNRFARVGLSSLPLLALPHRTKHISITTPNKAEV